MGKLFDQVCSLSVLMDAWQRVKRKKAAGGVDQITVQDFETNFSRNFEQLRPSLIDGTYTPEPLERIDAPKMDGSGEKRPLSLPSVKDKIVQQAVRSVIEPIFNAVFLDCSYAYRRGKGTQKAFKRVNHYLTTEGRRWAALGDFDRFFDTLDQDYLFRQVNEVIHDADIIRLIRMWVRIGFVTKKGDYFDVGAGVGQGSVISPLLSNLYAHPLDEYMTQKGHAYVRYSDNFIILCHDRQHASQALDDVKFFIHDVLKLELNANPQPIKSLNNGFVFLGIYYQGNRRAISTGKMRKIKSRLSGITRPGKTPDALTQKLVQSLDGTRRYYSVIEPEEQFVEIDEYVLQRLVPLLAEYLGQGAYRTIADLVTYISPLPFLSDTFNLKKDQHLRELAGMALKKHIGRKEQEKGTQPLKEDIREGIKTADRAVTRRKRKYLRAHALSSDVVVSTCGAFLGKTGNRLVVKHHKKNILTHHLDKIKNIVVAAKGVTVSSDLIWECSKQKIPIHFTNAHGSPYAMIHMPAQPQAGLGLLQLQARQNGQGLEIAGRVVRGKIKNQLNLMKFYGRSRKKNTNFQAKLDTMESEIEGLLEQTEEFSCGSDYDTVRDKLFSVEGRAASSYWAMVKDLLADDVPFPGRKRKGADDLVNSMLNYGYGILYARVWRAVTLSGLNPYVSFLHSPQKDKPTLVFDLIEEFRCQGVDRAVFTMISRRESLKLDKKTSLLSEGTRRKVVENVLERLASLVPYRSRKTKIDNIIRLQPAHLAACLEKGKKYRPFVGRY